MVSSLDNWDGSLSRIAKENASRIPNLLDSSTASGASTLNKTTDERIGQGWQTVVTTLDVNHTYDASNLNRPVTDMLAYPAATTSQTYHEQNLFLPSPPSCDSPLFTPPPEEYDCSVDTPSPPNQSQAEPASVQCQPLPQRLIMSHIQVPPLKRPRSDYRFPPTSRSIIVSKRRVASNPHISIQEGLQASIQHNADLGVLPWDSLETKKRKPTKKGRKDGEANAVAGPFVGSHPTADSGPVGPKKRSKRSFMDNDDDDDWGALPRSSRSKKRSRPISQKIVVDLTLTDDDESLGPSPANPSSMNGTQYPKHKVISTTNTSISKPLPRTRLVKNLNFVHAAHNSETDIVTLCLEDIQPVPLEILTLNTRFLRQSFGKEVGAPGPGGNESANINCTRQNGSRPCFLMINAKPSSVVDSEEEISVGGLIWELPEEGIDKEVIEIFSDSSLNENIPRNKKNVDVLSPQVSSLKNQHRKKPKPRRHPEDDVNSKDGNRTSTTFNVHRQPTHPPLQAQLSKIKVAPPNKLLDSQWLQRHVDDSPVRPPHSARSSLNSQTLESGSDYANGALPSAKVLGKRRAISPISTSVTTIPPRHPQFTVSSYSAVSMPDMQLPSDHSSASSPHYVQNTDYNAFMDYPAAISPPAVQQSSSVQFDGADSINTSSLSNSYNPLDTLASLFDEASSSRNQSEIYIDSDMGSSRNTSTRSHTLVYPGPGSRGESFFSSADSLYNDMGFPADRRDRQEQQYDDDPWSTSLVIKPEDQYTYETIDPTLLGGGALLGEAESELEPGLEMEMDADLDVVGMGPESETEVQQKDSSQGDVNLEPSNRSSSSSFGSVQEKKTTVDDPVPADDRELETQELPGRKLPPRKRTKRVMPDMISHDDIDLLLSDTAAGKANIRYSTSPSTSSSALDADNSESDSDSDSDSDSELDHESDDALPTVRKPVLLPKPQVTLKNPIARSVSPTEEKTTVSRAPKQQWPLDKVDTSCHQCRRKTFYAKMTCSDCRKKFCVRCYESRYPECEFDANDKDYSCPACEGFCNCTTCCRKRGEPYVGVRTCDPEPDSVPLRPQRIRNAKVERVKLGAQTNSPLLTTTVIQTTTIPQGVTQAWGSLYNATGEKIGACFFDPSAEKDNSVVFAPATTPMITTITEVAQQVATAASMSEPEVQVKTKIKLKRRIFIGEPQPCWGYKNPKIRLLKPEPYSKRSYNSMPRFYIGKKACLFYPIEEDESSLTPLDESDEVQEAEGPSTEGKSFSQDSLGDGDVTRAILLGLSACGVAAVEMPVI